MSPQVYWAIAHLLDKSLQTHRLRRRKCPKKPVCTAMLQMLMGKILSHFKRYVMITRGQWPFRPAATIVVKNENMILYDFRFLDIYIKDKKNFLARGGV